MFMYMAAAQPFFTAYSQADFFGKGIFLSLFILSGLSWVVLIYKGWQLAKVKKLCKVLCPALLSKQESFLHAHVQIAEDEIPHPFAYIFTALKTKTLEVLEKNRYFHKEENVYLTPRDLELIESGLFTEVSLQTKILEKNLIVLATTVTLAPFLGLLGTVWGILVTFSALHAGASASSSSLILGGLSTALATTVLGLVIAIPALIAYNYFKHCTKTLRSDMEDFAAKLLMVVEMQYRLPG